MCPFFTAIIRSKNCYNTGANDVFLNLLINHGLQWDWHISYILYVSM